MISRFVHLLLRPSARLPIIVLLLIGIFVGAGLLLATDSVVEFTGTDEFCISCHELQIAYDEYTETAHFANRSGVRAGCSDCHVPHDYPDKLFVKAARLWDVVDHLRGTIDTREKYDARRLEMARAVWARMEANDSAECRSCHTLSNMAKPSQNSHAAKAHSRAARADITCVSCHRGTAHVAPREPLPVEATPTSPGTAVVCSACHQSSRAILSERHPEVAEVTLPACFECHEPGETSPLQRNAFAVHLHKGHLNRVDCGGCHLWKSEAGFAVLGYESQPRPVPSYGWSRVEASTAAWVHELNLASLHGKAQFFCKTCHVDELIPGDNESVVNQQCVTCHGDLEKLAAAEPSDINPHRSHLGDINCSTCHRGHAPSEAYCLACHTFTQQAMAIPGGFRDFVPERARERYRKPLPADMQANAPAEQTDVVIVGSGAAGFTAAIAAHDSGARVMILEKQPITGGNSQLAAGGMNAAETDAQRAKGIEDSVEKMFEDTMKGGNNENDPALVRVLAKNSAASVAFLTELGADMSDVGRMGGSSINRTHRPTGGKVVGAHVIKVLRQNAIERKLDVRVNSRVVRILENPNGAVTGVLVQGKHGKVYEVHARAVVLAAGGFSANPERVARYRPEFEGMRSTNQPGATGDGVELGAAAGGEPVGMPDIQIHPTKAAGSGILITEAVRGNGAILVNREGKRFVNELTTRDKASAAILEQTGKTAFLIFDEEVRKSLKQIDGYFHLELVRKGRTPSDLASRIDIPGDTLEATLRSYNEAVENNKDAAFERPQLPRAIAVPEYYAIEVEPGVHYTMGGVKINTNTEVIGENGQPISGFFAAGEVTGGVHGANRLGGNSISETVTFGRIAGQNAARYAMN